MKSKVLLTSIILLTVLSSLIFFSLLFRVYIHYSQPEFTIINYLSHLFDIKLEKWGQSGDFIGGLLNPIIALVGSFLLYETYKITKKQIISADVDSKKQKTESIFFNLLNQHDNITTQLELNCQELQLDISASRDRDFFNATSIRGRLVFKVICQILAKSGSATHTYEILQINHNYILGHYFRNMYQLLKILHESDSLSYDEKRSFTRIFRAQLSSYELALLMINCLDNIVDNGEFRELLIKYQMLEHTPIKIIGNFVYINGFDSAFIRTKDIKQYIDPLASINDEFGAFGTNPAFIEYCSNR